MARSTAARKSPIAPTEIVSEVLTGGAPAAQNGAAGLAPNRSRLRAKIDTEYVSAGGFQALINYARALPHAIDDITEDLGDDLYERMLLDSQVSSMVNVMRASVLEDGVTLQPAITKEDDPDHDAAVEMADWCTAALARVRPTMPVVLWAMCKAFALGNKVAELVWEIASDPHTNKPALLLKSIKPKPRESVAFVVDSYNNLLGVLAQIPGQAYPVQQNMYVSQLDKIPNLLPPEKFCVLTFREEDGDPRGTSVLRQAYDPWWLAQQSRSLYLAFIAQFAGPSLIGTTPEGAETETTDDNGDPLPASAIVSPETAMATQLATLKSGTALSFPYGSQVTPLQVHGEGAAFEQFEDRQDRRIAVAILNNTLSVMEGKHQTRASSGTHQDITDTIVRQIRGIVEQMLSDQVLRLLVLFNFGEDALRLLPVPTLGRTEQHDLSSMAAAVAALQSSGYLGQSQKAGVDSMLGLPVRDEEADALAAAEALALATQLAETNPAFKGAARVESRQAAGSAVSADEAQAATKPGGLKSDNTVTGTPAPTVGKRARPVKEQANPGSQSGVEGS